jgi:uncharacterized protein (TIGR03089 family)
MGARSAQPSPGHTTNVLVMTDVRSFPDLLAQRLRADPGRPLLTAYDEQTGERTELSAVTFANWVSKTANLLTDELMLDDGDTVLLDLPSHWLVPVFLGAAWSSGLRVTTDHAVAHDLVVCGPDSLTERASSGADVLACSLRPFAVRFAGPLPDGVVDYGLAWPGQSDVFAPVVPPGPETPAWAAPDVSHGDLLSAARASGHPSGVRLLTDLHPAAAHGVPAFLAPLLHGGSVVLVSHPDEETWPARLEDERATVELRAADQPPSV